jgi:hypothetical protein
MTFEKKETLAVQQTIIRETVHTPQPQSQPPVQEKKVVLPFKLTERGPTEKNRDLLKAALQNAMTQTPAPKNVSAQPQPAQPVRPSPDLQSSGEISYQELRKVLE